MGIQCGQVGDHRKNKENFIVTRGLPTRPLRQTLRGHESGSCVSIRQTIYLYDESRNSDSIPIVSPLIETLRDEQTLSVGPRRFENPSRIQAWVLHRQAPVSRGDGPRVLRACVDDEELISPPRKVYHPCGAAHALFQRHVVPIQKLDENMSVFANRAILS